MTPLDRIDFVISDAATRMTSAKPSDALRANVLSRIAVERPARFAWRWVFAGGAVASVALMAVLSWPSNPTIPNSTISNPTVINPRIINASTNPTTIVGSASSTTSVVSTARIERTVQYAPSAAELEWRARATPALDHLDPLEVKSLELKSIDITPLGVAPLTVPALGDGSNR